MIRLALLRHGHTAWNRAGRIQGRTDIPLDDTARETLAALALPPGWAGAEVIASPLARAAETAALVARHPPRLAPALTEMDWGDWEGAEGRALRADPAAGFRDIERWGWDFRPPGGESPAEVWARLAPFLATLAQDAVAVTHIGVMRAILARAHGWDYRGPAPFTIKRARLYAVTFPPGDPSAMIPLPGPDRLIPAP
jgi:probable phosphoglycerate mutase